MYESFFIYIYIPEASFPFAFLVMTTFDETVVGVLAAITTPTSNIELIFIWSLKNNKTRPNTANGIIIKLMIWINKWSLIRKIVSANIFVRKDRADIKKITTTAPIIYYNVVNYLIFFMHMVKAVLPHLMDHSARIYPPFLATFGNKIASIIDINKPSKNQYFTNKAQDTLLIVKRIDLNFVWSAAIVADFSVYTDGV